MDEVYTNKGGWGSPALAKKFHWFVDGRSLCGNWMFKCGYSDRGVANHECCKACAKKLTKAKEEGAPDA